MSATLAVNTTRAYGINGGTTNFGVGRLIAAAFEVINTTPALQMQGSVTAYHGTNSQERVVANFVNLTVPTVYALEVGSALPVDLTTIQSIPGTVTWDAAAGCYVVGRFSDTGAFGCTNGTVTTPTYQPEGRTLSEGGTTGHIGLYSSTAFNTLAGSGVVFSGLGDTTSLRVTTRLVYEFFPEPIPNDPYLTLATPSALYDPDVFRAYSRAWSSLPPAVPVRMNFAGEWFGMVLRVIGTGMKSVGRQLMVEGGVPPRQRALANDRIAPRTAIVVAPAQPIVARGQMPLRRAVSGASSRSRNSRRQTRRPRQVVMTTPRRSRR